MEQWITDYVGIVLGWGLGLGSAALIDWWKQRQRAHDVKVAILRELHEIALRLLMIVFTLEGKFGRLDRDLLQWMRPQIERYAGPNPKDKVLAGIVGLLGVNDAELATAAKCLKETTPTHFLPSEKASYTATAVNQIHDFEPDYAAHVLDILSHIHMLNEMRDNEMYYTRLSLTPGLTSENPVAVIENATQAEIQIASRARIIVNKITDLETRFPHTS